MTSYPFDWVEQSGVYGQVYCTIPSIFIRFLSMFATHELQVIPVTFMKHFSSSSSSSAATRFAGNFTRRPLDPDGLAFPFTMWDFLAGDLDPDDEAGLISGMVRTV